MRKHGDVPQIGLEDLSHEKGDQEVGYGKPPVHSRFKSGNPGRPKGSGKRSFSLPELITEGDTLAEANANVQDAFEAVFELYAEQGRPLPASIGLPGSDELVWSETLVGSP